MASPSANSANSLTRFRPAILAFTAIAAGCTIYYVHNIISNSDAAPSQVSQQQNSLHRSNARRRGRQRRVTDAQTSDSNTLESDANVPRPPVNGARDRQEEPHPSQSEANGGESEFLASFEASIPENQGGEIVVDAESEHSWRGDADADDANKEGQSLLNLLYRIAEEQARKDGYVHRAVTCNSCNAMPIRGIRYRCANCVDFDLCEQCEALQVHPKTHLFYKVRVPAPFLGNPRQPQPVWYPGKPAAVVHNLSKDALRKFCKETGFQIPEIEALWEQFRCLAASEWLEDPSHYRLAIDRPTFDKCFVPNTSTRPPPPNLIYDRLFAFYDTNSDGLIGFDEFLKGLASLTKKNLDERRKRIFSGYDMNQDGYVDRKDFLRMFRANYALTKELLREVVSSMDDEMFDWSGGARDIVVSSQPISSAFSGAIQPGEQSRTGEGKVEDQNGDHIIFDNIGTVREEDTDTRDHNESLADRAECVAFGDVEENLAEDLQNCKSLLNKDLSDIAWPPDLLVFGDGCKALDKPLDWFRASDTSHGLVWDAVTEPKDRKKILLQALHRLESLKTKQQVVRQEGIYDRWRRRQFFIDDENGVVPPDGFERQERISPSHGKRHMDDASFTRVATLDAILKTDFANEFYTSVAIELQGLRWPSLQTFDSASAHAHKVLDMVGQGWTGNMVAEAISDCAPNFSEAIKFVLWVFHHIKDSEHHLEKGLVPQSPLESMPPSRRSRSSSKVRFQDDVATDDEHETRSVTSVSSRSIPMGERWGGYEIPEPEKDVGREVLYQVTQEALNELLDPIFKLREELAIRAMQTRAERNIFRAALDDLATAKKAEQIKVLVDHFLEVWYINARDGPYEERTNERDIILGFRIKAGGEIVDIRQRLETLYRSGEQARTDTDEMGYKQRLEQLGRKGYDLGPETVELKLELAELGPKRDEPGQQDDERDQDGNEREQSTTPIVVHTTTYDLDEPPASNEPEVALNLQEAVTAFNEADTSIEETTSQTPLDELLAVSGYAPIFQSPSPSSSPSRPTLPQRQPINNAPDPTLPQNRPNTADHSPTLPATALLARSSSSKSPAPSQPSPEKPTPPTFKTPSIDRLKHLLALDYIEEQDEQRGGPGRISYEEFETIMKGPKGQALGFVGEWIQKGIF